MGRPPVLLLDFPCAVDLLIAGRCGLRLVEELSLDRGLAVPGGV